MKKHNHFKIIIFLIVIVFIGCNDTGNSKVREIVNSVISPEKSCITNTLNELQQIIPNIIPNEDAPTSEVVNGLGVASGLIEKLDIENCPSNYKFQIIKLQKTLNQMEPLLKEFAKGNKSNMKLLDEAFESVPKILVNIGKVAKEHGINNIPQTFRNRRKIK